MGTPNSQILIYQSPKSAILKWFNKNGHHDKSNNKKERCSMNERKKRPNYTKEFKAPLC